MASRSTHTSHTHRLRGVEFARARLLLVDSDASRLEIHRQWIAWMGVPEPEWASNGDEALDLLGAAAQRFDVVAIWPPLVDDSVVDFAGILRRCNSPLRLMAATSLTPAEMARPGRLAGVGLVEDSGTPHGFIAGLETMLASSNTISDIVHSKRTPATLSVAWALAIYGNLPGQRFHADLD